MFQCHSPKSFHPLPVPQSPKDCSIHLCLFCCLAYRVIITVFINSIYMHQHTVLVVFFLLCQHLLFVFLTIAILRCEVISLIISDDQHLFMYLLPICVSMKKCLFMSSAHFWCTPPLFIFVFGVKSSKSKIDVKELTVSKCLVLGLTFRSLTHFELIFVCGVIQ